ncbi:uncharacterized protein LOC127700410 [Mytilus californianus]|uniref:uncharacterized protein LOC127700410 n=1 Tax=Mytilus californianus TaxID=6549 RepID=UPI002246BD5C|nr:uncharacterized protein LOC127700410 [Mytilus californianus]
MADNSSPTVYIAVNVENKQKQNTETETETQKHTVQDSKWKDDKKSKFRISDAGELDYLIPLTNYSKKTISIKAIKEQTKLSNEMNKEDLRILKALKSLFETCDTRIIVNKLIRATKELYSPELKVIMGNEYLSFQNLNRKEKINHLGERLNRFYKMEIRLIKEADNHKKEEEQRKRKEEEEAKEEAELKKELEAKIRSLLQDIGLTEDEKTTDDSNSSAISVLTSAADQAKFQNMLSFWKDVDSNQIKVQILEAMRDSNLSTDSDKVDVIGGGDLCVIGGGDPCVIGGGDPCVNGGDPCNAFSQPRFQKQIITWKWNNQRSMFLFMLIIVAIVGFCYLAFSVWWTPTDVQAGCFFCDSLSRYIFNKAVEIII